MENFVKCGEDDIGGSGLDITGYFVNHIGVEFIYELTFNNIITSSVICSFC
jgi:hypothetical protein